jgi:Zn-dependent peptidase ImmA (M78 family)
MTPEELLDELEIVAQGLGVSLRYEKGDFDGGYCILRDQKIIVINKKLNENQKASVIAHAFGELGIENIYIKPSVRLFIEDELVRTR